MEMCEKFKYLVAILFPNCRKTGKSNIFSLLAQPQGDAIRTCRVTNPDYAAIDMTTWHPEHKNQIAKSNTEVLGGFHTQHPEENAKLL